MEGAWTEWRDDLTVKDGKSDVRMGEACGSGRIPRKVWRAVCFLFPEKSGAGCRVLNGLTEKTEVCL